ncbi:hypothetical protein SEUCBS139899_001858 [Sporothrix eucalyptigena]|uniref:Fungal calcium binding protein domain-containing protein n=1 Tax=Sporothrix eucalyptigena TaxID=1812306 RepID=A0ABP0CNY9_9PEZI
MKFTLVVAAFVAVTAAAPSSPVVRDVDTVDNTDAAELCIHIRDCVDALSPTVKACARAARDKGKNLKEDAECLKEALDASIQAPDACKSCM